MEITRYVLGILMLLHSLVADPGVLRESVIIKTGQSKSPSQQGFFYNTRSRTSRLDADIQYKKISLLPFLKSDTPTRDKLIKEQEEVPDYERISVLNYQKARQVLDENDEDDILLNNRFFTVKPNRTTVAPVKQSTIRTTTTTERPFKPSQSQLEELFGKLSTPHKRHTTSQPDTYRPLPAVEKENPRPIQRTRVRDSGSGESPVSVPSLAEGQEDLRNEEVPAQKENLGNRFRKIPSDNGRPDPSRREQEEILKEERNDRREEEQIRKPPSRFEDDDFRKPEGKFSTSEQNNKQSRPDRAEAESDLRKFLNDAEERRRDGERDHPYLRNRGRDQSGQGDDDTRKPTEPSFPEPERRRPDRLPHPFSDIDKYKQNLRELENEDGRLKNLPARGAEDAKINAEIEKEKLEQLPHFLRPDTDRRSPERENLARLDNDEFSNDERRRAELRQRVEEPDDHRREEEPRQIGRTPEPDHEFSRGREKSRYKVPSGGEPSLRNDLASEPPPTFQSTPRPIRNDERQVEDRDRHKDHLASQRPPAFQTTPRPVRNDERQAEDDGLDRADIPPALRALLRSLDGQSPFQNLLNRPPAQSPVQHTSQGKLQPTVQPVQIPMVNVRPKGMHGMQLPTHSHYDGSEAAARYSGTSTPIPPRIFTPPIHEYYPPSPRMHLPKQGDRSEISQSDAEKHDPVFSHSQSVDFDREGTRNLDFHGPYSSAKTYIVPKEEIENRRDRSPEPLGNRVTYEASGNVGELQGVGIDRPSKQYENRVVSEPPSSLQDPVIKFIPPPEQAERTVFVESQRRPAESERQEHPSSLRDPVIKFIPPPEQGERTVFIESQRRPAEFERQEPSGRFSLESVRNSAHIKTEDELPIIIRDDVKEARNDGGYKSNYEGHPVVTHQVSHAVRDELNQKVYSASRPYQEEYRRPSQKGGSRPRRPKDPVIIRQSVGAALGGGGGGPTVINVINAHPSEPRGESYYEKELRYKEMYDRLLNKTKESNLRIRADVQSTKRSGGVDELNRRSISDDTEENHLPSSKRSEPLVFADSAWSPDGDIETPHAHIEDEILAALSHLGPRKEPNPQERFPKESELQNIPSRQISLNSRDDPTIEREEVQENLQKVLGSIARDEEIRFIPGESLRIAPGQVDNGREREDTELGFPRLSELRNPEIRVPEEGRIPSRQFIVNTDSDRNEGISDTLRRPILREGTPSRQYLINGEAEGTISELVGRDRDTLTDRIPSRQYVLNLEDERFDQGSEVLRIPAARPSFASDNADDVERVLSRQYFLNRERLEAGQTPSRQYILNEQIRDTEDSSLSGKPLFDTEDGENLRVPSRQYVLNQQIEEEVRSPMPQYSKKKQQGVKTPSRQYLVNQNTAEQETSDFSRDELRDRTPIRQYLLKNANPLNEDVIEIQRDKPNESDRALIRQHLDNSQQRPLIQGEAEDERPPDGIPSRQFAVNSDIQAEAPPVRPSEEVFESQLAAENISQEKPSLAPEPDIRLDILRDELDTQQQTNEEKPPVLTSHFVLFPNPEGPEPEKQPQPSSAEVKANGDGVSQRADPKEREEISAVGDSLLADIPVFPVREIVIVTPKPDKSLIRTEPPSYIFVEKKVRPDGVVLESIKGSDSQQFTRNGQSPTLLRLPSLEGIDGPVTLVLHDLRDLKNNTDDEPAIQTFAPFLASNEQVVTPGPAHVSRVYFSPVASQFAPSEQPYNLNTEPTQPQWRPLNVPNSSPAPYPLQPTTQRPQVYAPVSPVPIATTPRPPIKPSALLFHGPGSEPSPVHKQVLPLATQNGVAKLQGHVVTKAAKTKYYPKSTKGKPFSEIPISPPISWKPEVKWKASVGSVMSVKTTKLTKMVDLFSPNLIRPSRTTSKETTTKAPEFVKQIKPRSDAEAASLVKLRVPIPVNYTADTKKINGRPGRDYPVYPKPPNTSFQCSIGGLFADPETRCQVFHKCEGSSKAASFVCPKGTVYDQQTGICDWWFEVTTCGL